MTISERSCKHGVKSLACWPSKELQRPATSPTIGGASSVPGALRVSWRRWTGHAAGLKSRPWGHIPAVDRQLKGSCGLTAIPRRGARRRRAARRRRVAGGPGCIARASRTVYGSTGSAIVALYRLRSGHVRGSRAPAAEFGAATTVYGPCRAERWRSANRRPRRRAAKGGKKPAVRAAGTDRRVRASRQPVAHADPDLRFSVPSAQRGRSAGGDDRNQRRRLVRQQSLPQLSPGDAERIGDAFRYRRGAYKQAVWH